MTSNECLPTKSSTSSPSSSAKKLLLLRAKRRVRAERSLAEFVRQAWHIIEPGTVYVHNWHIDAISEHLEAVSAGEITRLVINVPPRFMKSTLVSVMWPAWTWIEHAAHQWLCGSYALKLAIRDALKMRRLVESPWYRERWGDRFELTSDQNQKVRFENDRTGYRIAFGMDGGVMGDGGHTVLVDDPHDRHGAHSDAERETTTLNYDQGVVTRLNDPVKSAIVIIMQRLHQNDLSGHVLAKDLGYEHLLIPMHFDAKRAHTTSIGWSDPRKENGELAWPDRFTEPVVVALEKELGSYAAAGQLEQRPAPAEGGIFKRSWWKFYDVLPEAFDEDIQSWDLNLTGTETSDFVAGQAWRRKAGNFYLKEQVYERIDFVETIAAMGGMFFRHPHGAKLVENKANGPAAIATLKHRIPGIIPVEPDGDKTARARAVAPYVESGNVYLPNPYDAVGNPRPERAWVLLLIENASTFPNGSLPAGSHGDDIDALTQAINKLAHGINTGSMWDTYFNKQAEKLTNG